MDKDLTLLAEAYEKTKQIEEGFWDRTKANLAGAKASAGSQMGEWGKAIKSIGQNVMGNYDAAAASSAAAKDLEASRPGVSVEAKIESFFNSKNNKIKSLADDIATDIQKLNLMDGITISSEDLTAKLKTALMSYFRGVRGDQNLNL